MSSSRPRGFTWPELLLVLALVGVIAGIALPALGAAIAHHRLQATSQALLEALSQARATAVRRDHATQVCASADGRTCSPSADWAMGWIGHDMEAKTIFESMEPFDPKLAATGRAGRREVGFRANGTAHGKNQTITLCVRGRPATAISIAVSNAGLAHRAPTAAADAASCAAAASRKR